MTAFRSAGEVRDWLTANGLASGALIEPQTLYELGAEWYATRLDSDWRRASAAEAAAMFERHGLTGPFWSLG
jgi:membrane protein DedA with SNARE-associated domain